MRGVVVVALSMALVACPKDPPTSVTDASTGGSSSTGAADDAASTAEVPTGGSTSAAETTAAATTGVAATGTTLAVGSEGSTTGEPATSGTSTGTETSSEGGDSTTGPPPRLFDCYGCDCDANTSYCQQVFNGVAKPPRPERRWCPEVEPDSLENGCAMYPASCEGLPTCTCLPQMGGACFCSEVEPGVFEVVCPLP